MVSMVEKIGQVLLCYHDCLRFHGRATCSDVVDEIVGHQLPIGHFRIVWYNIFSPGCSFVSGEFDNVMTRSRNHVGINFCS